MYVYLVLDILTIDYKLRVPSAPRCRAINALQQMIRCDERVGELLVPYYRRLDSDSRRTIRREPIVNMSARYTTKTNTA